MATWVSVSVSVKDRVSAMVRIYIIDDIHNYPSIQPCTASLLVPFKIFT